MHLLNGVFIALAQSLTPLQFKKCAWLSKKAQNCARMQNGREKSSFPPYFWGGSVHDILMQKCSFSNVGPERKKNGDEDLFPILMHFRPEREEKEVRVLEKLSKRKKLASSLKKHWENNFFLERQKSIFLSLKLYPLQFSTVRYSLQQNRNIG